METINDLLNGLYGQDRESLFIVLEAYENNCKTEKIEYCGFNDMSGYVYLSLENGISVVSCFARDAEYLVEDSEYQKEYFFDSYQEAQQKLNELN
jgi:hypothetical protein